jgi:S1-C subfamily serine protease
VTVHARRHIPSSGLHWRPGIIVTAEHTVRRDEEIAIVLPGGRTVPATVAGRDPGTDLAVLKAEDIDAPAVAAEDTEAPRTGHIVLAVGRGSQGGVTAAMGIVSATADAWRTWRGGLIDRLVRLDLALYPGLSGAAVVDAQGRLIGIATGGLTRTAAVAIPLSTVQRVAAELLATGRVRRGYLGVGLHPVELPERRGLIVVSVEAGGPADRAGILVGDILVALDGKPVADTDDVQAALGGESVGRLVRVSMVRGGQPAETGVTVGERVRGEA